jgi:regulatory protein YycI of two-component signal transduction system YycFG
LDLAKVKTVLIVAFLSLNIFLAYKLWFVPQSLQQGEVLSSEQIAETAELLQKHGFELVQGLPKQIPRMSLLHVVRSPQKPEEWADIFLDEPTRQKHRLGDKTIFWVGESIVEVMDNGKVTFITGLPGTGEESSRTVAERFLRDLGLWQPDFKLDLAVPWREKGYNYRFVQTYQGFPLFFSTINVYVNSGTVQLVEIEQALAVDFSDKDVMVISAQKALEVFVKEAANFPSKRIIDISLGYYSQHYDANSWESAPVWRVATADGQAVYINAFTGEIEK